VLPFPTVNVYPCFEHPTLSDKIENAGHTWRYYTNTYNYIWTAPTAISHICGSTGPGGTCNGSDYANVVLEGSNNYSDAQIIKDIQSCNLQDVSWVIPNGLWSDHPLNNNGSGPDWVTAIINAVGAAANCDSPNGYWADTAILLPITTLPIGTPPTM
jgi:phospholipase C